MVKKAIIVFGGVIVIVLALVVSGVMLPADYSSWVATQLHRQSSKPGQAGQSPNQYVSSGSGGNAGASPTETEEAQELTAMMDAVLAESSSPSHWLDEALQSNRFWQGPFAQDAGGGDTTSNFSSLVSNEDGPMLGSIAAGVGSLAAMGSEDDEQETGGPETWNALDEGEPGGWTVPEPGTLSLFAIGLLICGFLAYQKWRSKR